MKKEDKSLIDVENVETTYFDNLLAVISSLHWPTFSFVSSISVLLLSHYVLVASSLVCSLVYPSGVIRLNITTTSARRLTILCCSCLEVFAQFCAVTM